MSKAKHVLDVMKTIQEVDGKPISNAADLKSGQNVIFKQGTPHAGLLGIVIGPTPGEPGKVDLKVGKQTSIGVSVGDLLWVSSPGSGIGVRGKE